MNRRIVLITGAAVAAVIVAAALWLAFFFPSSWARRLIVSRMERTLARPVAVETARVRLLPRARIDVGGLAIGDSTTAGAPWIRAQSVKLGCRLRPLLRREVSVTDVTVESPVVEFTMAPPAAPPPARGGAPAAAPGAGAAFALRLDRVAIQNARVVVRGPDRAPFFEMNRASAELEAQIGASADVDLEMAADVPDLRLHLPGASLGKDLPVRLEGKLHFDAAQDLMSLESVTIDLAGVPVTAEGTLGALRARAPVADLRLHGGPAPVSQLAGFVPAGLLGEARDIESSGVLEVSGTVSGALKKPGGPSYDITLRLSGGSVRLPQKGREAHDITLDLRATPSVIEVREFAAHSGKSSARLKGTFTGFPRTPRMQIAGDADLDLADVAAFSPKADSLALAGRLRARFVAEGPPRPPEAIEASGDLVLDGVSARPAGSPVPLTGARGTVVMDRHTVYVHDVSMKLGTSDLALRGTIQEPLALGAGAAPGKRAKANLRLTSGFLDLDELVPPPPKDGGTAATRKPTPLPAIDGAIAVEVGQLRARGIAAENVRGTALLEGGIVTLKGVGLGAFGGTVDLDGTVDLRDLSNAQTSLTVDVSRVKAEELLAKNERLDRFGKLAGALTGRLSAHAKLDGPLDSTLAIVPARLTSEGTLSIADGHLANLPIQKQISDFLNLPGLSSLAIAEWVQPFSIHDGRLNFTGMALKADGAEAVASGWQALDGTLEVRLDVWLPPEASAAIRSRLPAEAAAVLLGNANERVLVPLVVTGKATKPSVSLDSARLTAEARARAIARLEEEKKRLAEAARRAAEDAARRATGAPADTTPLDESMKDKVKEEIEDKLKDIFRR